MRAAPRSPRTAARAGPNPRTRTRRPHNRPPGRGQLAGHRRLVDDAASADVDQRTALRPAISGSPMRCSVVSVSGSARISRSDSSRRSASVEASTPSGIAARRSTPSIRQPKPRRRSAMALLTQPMPISATGAASEPAPIEHRRAGSGPRARGRRRRRCRPSPSPGPRLSPWWSARSAGPDHGRPDASACRRRRRSCRSP